jgi:hypothetical protein
MEKEKILKELRRRQFMNFLNEKEFLAGIIGGTLKINPKYVEEKIKYEDDLEISPYDLIVKVTDTRIKIRTSKYNKKIENIKNNSENYKIYYDEKNKEYKIKINIDKVFEQGYNEVNKDEIKRIREMTNKKMNDNEIIDFIIASLSIQYCDNVQLSLSASL